MRLLLRNQEDNLVKTSCGPSFNTPKAMLRAFFVALVLPMTAAFLIDLQTDPDPFRDLNVIEIMVKSRSLVDEVQVDANIPARNVSSLDRPEIMRSIDCSKGLTVHSDVDLARLKPGAWSAARIAFGASDGHNK